VYNILYNFVIETVLTYNTFRTVLLLIQMVTEYCIKADEINLAAQSLLRYVCDILREYNSRSHYLVLQAKAISNKTGLKKITCTNLVLSLRALQLLLWIVPFIQTHFSSN